MLGTCRCLGDGRVVNRSLPSALSPPPPLLQLYHLRESSSMDELPNPSPIYSKDIFTDGFELNRKRKLQSDLENSPLPFPKHKFRYRFRSCDPAGTSETNDASNWISVTATEELRDDDGSEDPEESHHDSNTVSEGYDSSHTTMTLDLDLAEESSERMNLNSPSVSSLKNMDPNDLDSFATLNVEDAKQLESVYRGIEGQLPEPEDDAGIEDFFIYSNDVAPHAFVVSSQRLLDGQDSRSRTKKPRIDEEFEQYFSMLML